MRSLRVLLLMVMVFDYDRLRYVLTDVLSIIYHVFASIANAFVVFLIVVIFSSSNTNRRLMRMQLLIYRVS